MRPLLTPSLLLPAILLGAVLGLALPAQAGELEDLKRQGIVGERFDGYLGTVQSDVPAAVRKLVETINAERRAKYAEVAARTGASIDEVAAIAGKKLVERAGPGEYVMLPADSWVRR